MLIPSCSFLFYPICPSSSGVGCAYRERGKVLEMQGGRKRLHLEVEVFPQSLVLLESPVGIPVLEEVEHIE